MIEQVTKNFMERHAVPGGIIVSNHRVQTIRSTFRIFTMVAIMNTERFDYFWHANKLRTWEHGLQKLKNTRMIVMLDKKLAIPSFSVSKTMHGVVRNFNSFPKYLGTSSLIWIRFCNDELIVRKLILIYTDIVLCLCKIYLYSCEAECAVDE